MTKSKWKELFYNNLDKKQIVSDQHRLETAIMDSNFSLTQLGDAFKRIAKALTTVNEKYQGKIDDYKAEKNQSK